MPLQPLYRRTISLLFLFAATLCARQADEPLRQWTITPTLVASARLPALIPHRELKRPKIALVLSGGGARGTAAIGVLEAFEKLGVPIDFIAGTSIGSIVGGLYASGYSVKDLKAVIDTTNWEEILSLSSEARRKDLFYDQKLSEDKSLVVLRFDGLEPILPQAFSTGQRLTTYLNILSLQSIYHPDPSFDDLRIPFRAVATDLISGNRVVIDSGDLSEALRASVTVPLLFNPVKRDTTELLDGGLTSNIPADIAREWGADIVVAVDVTSPLRKASELNAPWEIADQIIGIAMQLANKEQLKFADYVIRPAIGNHSSTDFTNLDSLIERGEASALPVLNRVKRDFERRMMNAERDDSSNVILVHPTIQYDATSLDSVSLTVMQNLTHHDSLSTGDLHRAISELYATGWYEDLKMHVATFPDRSLVRLEEHRFPIVRKLVFEGNSVVPTDTLNAVCSFILDKPINHDMNHSVMRDLFEVYRSRGYSLARVRSMSFDRVTGTITIDLDEGVVYRRTIVGTTKTKDYVLWRELPWKEGDVFNVQAITDGLNNLYGTNLFEQVSIGVQKEGAQDHQIVTINARERYTDLIRLGMTVDNERNVQPSIDIRDENFLGVASELGVHFFGGLRNRYYLGEFKINRIFNSYLTFNLHGYYDLRDINVFKDGLSSNQAHWSRVREGEYREVREGTSASFGTQLERLGQVTIEGRSEYQRVWSIFNQPVAPETFHIRALKVSTRVDTRDRFPYPRDGTMMELSYESGKVRGADNVGFSKLFFDYQSYKTFFGRNAIRPRVMFGFGDETVPLTEQFTLGGQDTFFGYREDNSRGTQLLLLSLEYRYSLPIRILFDTYFKLRYDLGHIWEKAEQIRLKDMRHAVGIGLGFDTPIGPADFSIGRAFFIRKDLLHNPLSFGPVVAYFRIGYAF
jgi:NTE family protein